MPARPSMTIGAATFCGEEHDPSGPTTLSEIHWAAFTPRGSSVDATESWGVPTAGRNTSKRVGSSFVQKPSPMIQVAGTDDHPSGYAMANRFTLDSKVWVRGGSSIGFGETGGGVGATDGCDVAATDGRAETAMGPTGRGTSRTPPATTTARPIAAKASQARDGRTVVEV